MWRLCSTTFYKQNVVKHATSCPVVLPTISYFAKFASNTSNDTTTSSTTLQLERLVPTDHSQESNQNLVKVAIGNATVHVNKHKQYTENNHRIVEPFPLVDAHSLAREKQQSRQFPFSLYDSSPLFAYSMFALQHSPELLQHLHWMVQKEELQQDMMLIGPPSPLKLALCKAFSNFISRPLHSISLSRDTSEPDITLRKEIVGNNSIFVEQPAVKAALQGHILVLDGLEKAERNMLPLLNNLVENREMQLNDGRFLVHHKTYKHLTQTRSNKQLSKLNLLPVHPDFRVIGLTLPVPPYKGTTLDPPLRSRFQGRYIPDLSFSTTSSLLHQIHHSSATKAKIEPMYGKIVNFGESIARFESASSGYHLEALPFGAEYYFMRALQTLPSLQTSKTFKEELIKRIYPYDVQLAAQYGNNADAIKQAVEGSLENFELKEKSKKRHQKDTLVKDATISVQAITREFEQPNHPILPTPVIQGFASCNINGNEERLPLPLGNSFKDTTITAELSNEFPNLPQMLLDHSIGKDICLIGEKGCGKTRLIRQFADLLGYRTQSFLLFNDMSCRDLLLTRATSDTTEEKSTNLQDTKWEFSPLIKAAINGDLAILDNIERLPPTALSSIASLLQFRDLSLYDGTRLLNLSQYEQLLKHNSKEELASQKIIPIHPSFRVIATCSLPIGCESARGLRALSSLKGAELLSPEGMQLFHLHHISLPNSNVLPSILMKMVPNGNRKIANNLVHVYNQLNSPKLQHLQLSISPRHLFRAFEFSSRAPKGHEAAWVRNYLQNACLISFAPAASAEALSSILDQANFSNTAASPKAGITTEASADSTKNSSDFAHLVPKVEFFENQWQLDIIERMKAQLALGHHLLLVGNQGVGKNKLVDQLLQSQSSPRQYIQLHRDITVHSIVSQPALKDGAIVHEDSALIKAVKEGHILVVDEADKAPTHVVCVLKSLIDGEMTLPDGRKLLSDAVACIESTATSNTDIIRIHPNFRLIVLANRPKWPFLGNDFYKESGDLFSCYAVDNPPEDALFAILQRYAPNLPDTSLKQLIRVFSDLRSLSEKGTLSYPYSTRECISVAKHANKYSDEPIANAFANVLAFDVHDFQAIKHIRNALTKHGFSVPSDFMLESNRQVVETKSRAGMPGAIYKTYVAGKGSAINEHSSLPPTDLMPKHGQVDPANTPHVGGNTWAGGTGGSDTAGLGGKGGPYRLDSGHTVYQVPDEVKNSVPKSVQDAARAMGKQALQERLKQIDMTTGELSNYESYKKEVKEAIEQLTNVVKGLESKSSERVWLRNRTSGELDDAKLVDALSGDKAVYRTRGADESTFSSPMNKKKMCFIVDVSGSMYRFNGFDGRLEKMLEVAVMIMETMSAVPDEVEYEIRGHSGESCNMPLVQFGKPPKTVADRYRVLQRMVAYSQYCLSGDQTLEAAEQAISDLQNDSASDKFVFLFSDANLERYGIRPAHLGSILQSSSTVKSYALFIATLHDEAERLKQGLPIGRGHVCLNMQDLPQQLQKLLQQEALT